MTGELCWFGDRLGERNCAKCEYPICRDHAVDSYLGINCMKCNEEELQSGLKRELYSWARWIGFGLIFMILVYIITIVKF